MTRYPNGNVEYVDSPLFIGIVLSLIALGLGVGAWASAVGVPPHYFVSVVLAIATVLCLAGLLMQQRSTFLFDPSIKTMKWTARGLFRNASGEVAFDDIGITIGEIDDSKSGPTYRVVLTTPSGPMPLTNALIGNRGIVEQQAADLRTLLGQTN